MDTNYENLIKIFKSIFYKASLSTLSSFFVDTSLKIKISGDMVTLPRLENITKSRFFSLLFSDVIYSQLSKSCEKLKPSSSSANELRNPQLTTSYFCPNRVTTLSQRHSLEKQQSYVYSQISNQKAENTANCITKTTMHVVHVT